MHIGLWIIYYVTIMWLREHSGFCNCVMVSTTDGGGVKWAWSGVQEYVWSNELGPSLTSCCWNRSIYLSNPSFLNSSAMSELLSCAKDLFSVHELVGAGGAILWGATPSEDCTLLLKLVLRPYCSTTTREFVNETNLRLKIRIWRYKFKSLIVMVAAEKHIMAIWLSRNVECIAPSVLHAN